MTQPEINTRWPRKAKTEAINKLEMYYCPKGNFIKVMSYLLHKFLEATKKLKKKELMCV